MWEGVAEFRRGEVRERARNAIAGRLLDRDCSEFPREGAVPQAGSSLGLAGESVGRRRRGRGGGGGGDH
jgi:hypothetical protein